MPVSRMIPASLGAGGWMTRRRAAQEQREAALRAFGGRRSVTDSWPDPYGPDPVVFGRVPRRRYGS